MERYGRMLRELRACVEKGMFNRFRAKEPLPAPLSEARHTELSVGLRRQFTIDFDERAFTPSNTVAMQGNLDDFSEGEKMVYGEAYDDERRRWTAYANRNREMSWLVSVPRGTANCV
jgi:hypothetical protein